MSLHTLFILLFVLSFPILYDTSTVTSKTDFRWQIYSFLYSLYRSDLFTDLSLALKEHKAHK